jgi:hypothetical protein
MKAEREKLAAEFEDELSPDVRGEDFDEDLKQPLIAR